MHSFYLDQIRKFEGYSPQAAADYAQLSNGYGTRARFPGEVIGKAEAERRFQTEVAAARAIVDKAAPNADEGTKAALTSLTYNAGPSWVESGLGEAVRRGDLDQAREIFQKYTKAGGEVLPGLVSRRSQEAMWIGKPDMLMTASVGASGPAETSSLPPVIPHREAGAMRLAEILDHRPVDSGASHARVPRAAASGSQAGLSPDAILALNDAMKLVEGAGVADMTRLLKLGNASTLATSSERRDNNETRRA
jgi:lysozyme